MGLADAHHRHADLPGVALRWSESAPGDSSMAGLEW